MYHFKLEKPHYVFPEKRFSTSDVKFAISVATMFKAELYYWNGEEWLRVVSESLDVIA